MTEYLTAEVTAVCVLNPKAGTAIVYRDSRDPEPFAADAEPVLPDVLPGCRPAGSSSTRRPRLPPQTG